MKNERIKKRIVALILASVTAVTLFSCSGLHKMTYADGVYTDTKTKIVYSVAPIWYEPIKLGEKYGKYKGVGDGIVYTVDGLESEKWLCDSVSGVNTLFCSEEIRLPAFSDFSPSSFDIFISDGVIKFSSNNDAALIKTLSDMLKDGENIDIPFDDTAIYYLKFRSADYAGIYYNIMAIHDRKNGRIYIHDRAQKKTVDTGSTLFGYLPYTNSLIATPSAEVTPAGQ